jgi:hypothetical protein
MPSGMKEKFLAIAFLRSRIISRAIGQSAVACAAYRAGVKLHDQRAGKSHDYRAKEGVKAEGIFLPAGAPEWMRDREKLWNAVEQRENRSNRPGDAQLARELIWALPHELTDEQRRFLVQNVAKNLARQGMVVDYAIHEPNKGGDQRNHHAHLLLTMRTVDLKDADGFGGKERAWNKKEFLSSTQAMIAEETNKMLKRAGVSRSIDFTAKPGHEPQVHLGAAATALERKGVQTRAGNKNRAIAAKIAPLSGLNRSRLSDVAATIKDALSGDPMSAEGDGKKDGEEGKGKGGKGGGAGSGGMNFGAAVADMVRLGKMVGVAQSWPPAAKHTTAFIQQSLPRENVQIEHQKQPEQPRIGDPGSVMWDGKPVRTVHGVKIGVYRMVAGVYKAIFD